MEKEEIPNSRLLVAVIGDTHLRDTQYATSRRGPDFFNGMKKAVQLACDNADIIVITGDVFDKPRPSPLIINQLMQIDQMLRRAKKFALTITGNHDWNTPTWLSTLFPDRDESSEGGIIPMDRRAFVFRGYRFVGLEPYNASSFRTHLADITVAARDADVVLFHGLVMGVADFNIRLQDPLTVDELPVSKRNLAWCLGDIHQQSFTEVPRPGGGECLVCYPGSTEMCSASEDTRKSVPILEFSNRKVKVHALLPFATRAFVKASIREESQLDELMEKLAEVKDQHPVVIVQFDRRLPQVIARIHSMLDAQRSVIRCYPLPVEGGSEARVDVDEDEDDLTMEHFVATRFPGEENAELCQVAMDLLHRGEQNAASIVADFVDREQERAATVRN